MTVLESDGKRNVSDILRLYPELGIPHFQRGLIWDEEDVASFIESLFFNTPCGMLVFWKPCNNEEGESFIEGRIPSYLVVDGQQRINALYESLGNIFDSDSKIDDNLEETWCINLNRLSEFKGYEPLKLYLLDKKSGDLFLKIDKFIKDENESKQVIGLEINELPRNWRYKRNFVPLSYFLNIPLDNIINSKKWPSISVNTKINSVQLKEIKEKLKQIKEQLHSIREREFSYILKDRDVENSEIVKIYNRINSGGRKVESEEKTFATLTELYKKTNDEIKSCFEIAHRKSILGRRSYLKRMRESSLGFKYFIRLYIQVAAYHCGVSIGRNLFSFDLLNNGQIMDALDIEENPKKIWEETKEILNFIAKQNREGEHSKEGFLADTLYCDEYRFIPDMASLQPLIQVLLLYPDLKQGKYKSILTRIALMLMLNPKTEVNNLKIIRLVEKELKASKCISSLSNEIETHKVLLDKQLECANSIKNRYILMLYWLIRKHKAQDFSYKDNLNNNTIEREISWEAVPQAQHIIPYDKLRKIYPELKEGRRGTHIANNIGNITYISSFLNNHITGLGNKFFNLDAEEIKDDEQIKKGKLRNLKSHYLEGEDIKKVYNELKEILEKEEGEFDRKYGKTLFERFCSLRRQKIAEGFLNWIEELHAMSPEILAIKPSPRYFFSSARDEIIRKGYNENIEECLLSILTIINEFNPSKLKVDGPKRRIICKEKNNQRQLFIIYYDEYCVDICNEMLRKKMAQKWTIEEKRLRKEGLKFGNTAEDMQRLNQLKEEILIIYR